MAINYDKLWKRLRPAVKMRAIIQRQLEILDPKEYRKDNKQMPIFSLRKDF